MEKTDTGRLDFCCYSRIFVDFNNTDDKARVRLNGTRALKDLNWQGIPLKSGVKITMYQDEIEIEGELVFSEEEEIWVARVNWWKIVEEKSQAISN